MAELVLDLRAERPEPIQVEDQVDDPIVKQGRGQQPPRLAQAIAARDQETGLMCCPSDDCSVATMASTATHAVIG